MDLIKCMSGRRGSVSGRQCRRKAIDLHLPCQKGDSQYLKLKIEKELIFQRLTQLTYLCHTLERRAESPASVFPKCMTEDRILCLSQFGFKGGKSREIYPTLSSSSGGWRKGLVKVQFQWRNLHLLCFLGFVFSVLADFTHQADLAFW